MDAAKGKTYRRSQQGLLGCQMGRESSFINLMPSIKSQQSQNIGTLDWSAHAASGLAWPLAQPDQARQGPLIFGVQHH